MPRRDRPPGDPVPRCYEGRTAALLAGGPSLSISDVEFCADNHLVLFGVNDCYLFGVNVLYAADYPWIYTLNDKIPRTGALYTCSDDAVRKFPDWTYIHVPGGKGDGISLDPSKLYSGGNTGFQLLNLAVLMGCNKILLLGYDMRIIGGKNNWFGARAKGLNCAKPDGGKYVKWAKHFHTARDGLRAAGVSVINCTPGSAITAFPSMPLREAIE